MRVLDLFSGIGGFSLGLERTGGFRTVAFCEIDPFCQRVLRKHWPEVPIYDDIRDLTAAELAADGIVADVLCGGFPCQDISDAGWRVGLDGERSGLWSEYARLIGEILPRFVIVENVAALLGRGLERVLGDLAALGFDAEWHCIPASAVGAPHRRDRVWIVADSDCDRRDHARKGPDGDERAPLPAIGALSEPRLRPGRSADVADADRFAPIGSAIAREQRHPWPAESDVDRVVDGFPGRVEQVTALGNAVVPKIPELIGRAILAQAIEARRVETPSAAPCEARERGPEGMRHEDSPSSVIPSLDGEKRE